MGLDHLPNGFSALRNKRTIEVKQRVVCNSPKCALAADLLPFCPPSLPVSHENTELVVRSHICQGQCCLLCLLPTLAVTSCFAQNLCRFPPPHSPVSHTHASCVAFFQPLRIKNPWTASHPYTICNTKAFSYD